MSKEDTKIAGDEKVRTLKPTRLDLGWLGGTAAPRLGAQFDGDEERQGEHSRCRARLGKAWRGLEHKEPVHVAVGKTRKARVRDPPASTLVPRPPRACQGDQEKKEVLEGRQGARTDTWEGRRRCDGRNSRPEGDVSWLMGDEAQKKGRPKLMDSCGYLVAEYPGAA